MQHASPTAVAVLVVLCRWASGVINEPQDVIQKDLDLKDSEWAVFVGLFPIGGLIGTQVAGPIADKCVSRIVSSYSIDRRPPNRMGAAVTVLQIRAEVLPHLELRFLHYHGYPAADCGVHHGAEECCLRHPPALADCCRDWLRRRYGESASLLPPSPHRSFIAFPPRVSAQVVVPTYLTEIASTNVRGAFGALNQFAVVIGILISNLVGLGLTKNWKWMFAIAGFLGVAQLLLSGKCVESPQCVCIERIPRGE